MTGRNLLRMGSFPVLGWVKCAFLVFFVLLFQIPALAEDGNVILEMVFGGSIAATIDNSTNPINFTVKGNPSYGSTNSKYGSNYIDLDDVNDWIDFTGYNLTSKLNLNSSTASGSFKRNMTILAWVAGDDFSSGEYDLIFGFQGHGGGCTQGACGINFAPWPGGKAAEARIATSPTTHAGCQNTGTKTLVTEWNAWYFTFDNANWATGINTTQTCTGAATTNYFPNNAGFFPKIGFTGSNQNEYSNFRMAHLCIINASLNASQLSDYYNSGSGQVPCGEIRGIKGVNDIDEIIPVAQDTQIVATARDLYDNSGLTNFSVTVYNLTHTFTNSTITGGNVKFGGLVNFTTYTANLTSNNSGGYFNRSVTVTTNLSTSADFTTAQAYAFFNATQLFTEAKINGFNITDLNVSNQSIYNTTVLWLRAGSYTIYANASNHFQKNINLDVAPFSNTTTNILFGNVLANFTAFDKTTNHTISAGYTLTAALSGIFVNTSKYTTTAFLDGLLLLSGYTYNITANFTNNAVETVNKPFYIASGGNNNLSIFSQTIHSLNLQVYNEVTKSLLNNINLSISIIGSTNSYNLTTSNGTLFKGNLTPDEYEVKYSADGFKLRSYFITLPLGGAEAIDLYLIDTGNSSELKIVVRDQNFNLLEEAIIQSLRFYEQSNSYEIVEMTKTAFDGLASMHLQSNNPSYKFRVLVDGVTKYTSVGSRITTEHVTQGLNFQINLEQNPLTAILGLESVQHSLAFSSSTNSFTLSVVDTNKELSEACLVVDRFSKGQVTQVNNSCTTSQSATIILAIDNSTDGYYSAYGVFNKNSTGDLLQIQTTPVTNFVDLSNRLGILGNFVLFLGFLFILGVGLMLLYDPRAAIIGAALSFGMLAYAGLTVFTAASVTVILGMAFVIAWMMKARGEQ